MQHVRPLVLRRLAPLIPATLLLAACDGAESVQSMLHPQGAGARDAAALWWMMFAVGGAVYLVVLGLLAWGLLRRRAGETRSRSPSVALWLGIGGVAVPIVILAGVLTFTLGSMRMHASVESGSFDHTITVVGHRWWWEVTYQDPTPQRRVTTANEIAIPVGQPVKLELESRDVIHSLWVPNLQSKTDLIPGRTNTTWIQADEPGVYRGQCGEFCGAQHANMGLLVVALPEDDFDAWYEGQLEPAAEPSTALQAEGRDVFLEGPCSTCHAVRGTLALASFGPDLTHLASRRTLAAATLPNTRGHLGGWINDPQGIKPGNQMPNVHLESEELLALIAYLESLE